VTAADCAWYDSGWACTNTALTQPDTFAPNNKNTDSGCVYPTGYYCPGEPRLPQSCPVGYYQVDIA